MMDGVIFREPDNANTVLLIHSNDDNGSQTFVDSKNGREILNAGSAAVEHRSAKWKFGASSIFFDNSSGTSFLTLADNADWDSGTGALTIDFWINFDDVAADHGILSHYSADDLCWGLKWKQSTSELFFRNINGAMSDVEIEFSWSPSANTWYHVAFIRSWGDHSDLWSGCIDGTEIDSGESATINIPPTNTGVLKIGSCQLPSDVTYLRGYMDEFRMVKGAAAWTENFTPPKGMYI